MADHPIPHLSRPANGALAEAGLTTLEEIARHTERDLLSLHGMGPKAIRMLTEAMTPLGLAFAEPPPRARRSARTG